ncbi:MAG: DUF1801 domain-containing protein [Chloroflexota bacterium]
MDSKKTQFDKDMQSEFKALFLQVRGIVMSIEGVVELKKERITTYSDANGGLCHVRTTKDGVDIGYLKGAQFHDKFGCLTGKTKKMRVQSLRAAEPIDEESIHYYLQEGIRLNQ